VIDVQHRRRVRELGVTVGRFDPGPRNALVDVDGVRVGHATRVEGDAFRTGATAVLAHGGDPFAEKVLAGVHVINGYGKAAGLTQVAEMGTLESPVLITNTFSVGAAWQAGLRWVRERTAEQGTVNVVVMECDDSPLNDAPVTEADAVAAIEAARRDETAEGSVGAGTGMSCLGFKAGVGTSSRAASGHTLGCLVVANYGSARQLDLVGGIDGDGSIVIVLATDAPLSERQLRRLAARATFGLARAGSFGSSGSGDYALAFSTAHRVPHRAEEGATGSEPEAALSFAFLHDASRAFRELLEMTGEVVEEAILNSLCVAAAVPGRDAFPHERLSGRRRPVGPGTGSSSPAGRWAAPR
jgi:D-aminopeptidase